MKRVISDAAIAGLVGLLATMNWVYRDSWRGGLGAVAGKNEGENSYTPINLPNSRKNCGAMSLFLICRASGKLQGIGELRKMLKSSADETSMLKLRDAAQLLGFDVEPCRLSFQGLWRHLDGSQRYAVLHFKSGHFAPALGVAGERIRMLDPEVGADDVDEAKLRSFPYGWDGVALLVAAKNGHER